MDIPRDFHDILTGALQAAIHDTASQRNSNQTTTTTATGSGPSRDLGFVISLESENNIVSRESNENAAQDETSESCIALQAIQRSWNSGVSVTNERETERVKAEDWMSPPAMFANDSHGIVIVPETLADNFTGVCTFSEACPCCRNEKLSVCKSHSRQVSWECQRYNAGLFQP